MNISSDLFAATITQPLAPPQAEGEVESPASHVSAIAELGNSLSENVRDSLLTYAQNLQESGASFDEVKAFVNSELSANGVDVSASGQRSGQLINFFS